MFNATDLFKSRLKEHITLLTRYLRYIFNGHFTIAIFFAIITLAVYYQKALENVHPNFPAAFIVAIVLGFVVLYNPIQTFLKEPRSEEHTSELQSRGHLVCRLLLEKKNNKS